MAHIRGRFGVEGVDEGVELVKKALVLKKTELLFSVDKLMSELVMPPAPTHDGSAACSPESRVITLAPMNSFDRKLVHIMVGTTSHQQLPHLILLLNSCRGRGTASRRRRTRASSSGILSDVHAASTRSSTSVWLSCGPPPHSGTCLFSCLMLLPEADGYSLF